MAEVSALANLLSDADVVAHLHCDAAFAQMGEKTELVAPMLDQKVVSTYVLAETQQQSLNEQERID